MQRLLFTLFALGFTYSVYAQLQPGFDKEEYRQLMYVSARTANDSTYASKFPEPDHFRLKYRSEVIGIDNLWDLWSDGKGTAALSIRGTTANPSSWLVNVYAAMVPAKGKLQLSDSTTFEYALAEDPKAAVHVGWLISTAFLANDMLPKIDSAYAAGTRNYLIMGHSQGGAIAFLLTAHLRSLQKSGRLGEDMVFKTYCSAGPKPGNLYFAYEYESAYLGDWTFNVINSADWVPETPISIQTSRDFNTTNPFTNAKKAIKKTPFPQRLALKHVYKSLDKPTRKAQKKYERYLGKMVSALIKKNLPTFSPPEYFHSNNYVRTGHTIVLKTNEAYYKAYPDGTENVFIHHFHQPYLMLLEDL